jgi:hypothetical protein
MLVNSLFGQWNRWVLTGVAIVAIGGIIVILGEVSVLMGDSPRRAQDQDISISTHDAVKTPWLPALPKDPEFENLQSMNVKSRVLVEKPGAFQGYTLLAPFSTGDVDLVDMAGRVVHSWKTGTVALNTKLLDNGHVVRLCEENIGDASRAKVAGRLQEFTWDGQLVWDYQFPNIRQAPTHDFLMLPNGHVLIIASEKKSVEEAIADGRRPDSMPKDYLLSDAIIELEPTGMTTAKIVWEWHAWDHLVQQLDADKPNYGDVRAHPELVDLNFLGGAMAQMMAKPEELKRLLSIGYVSGQNRKAPANWLHANSISYSARLDQIMLGLYEFSEIWIIDHSCTTKEAAAHQGGRYGKGGDLLYRCGNPRTYGGGSIQDRHFFCQHDAHWIPDNLPGAGHLLIFNNGSGRIGGSYSSVDELVLPDDGEGHYARTYEGLFEAASPVWSYAAPVHDDMFDAILSGAERLPNGDTLICSGTHGTVLEVTAEGEVVWKYVRGNDGALPPWRAGGAARAGRPEMQTPPTLANSIVGPQAHGFGSGPPLFRAPRYGPDYAGLSGKELTPERSFEELHRALGHAVP